MTEPTDWGQKKLARTVGEQLGRQRRRVNRALLEPVVLSSEFWDEETAYMQPPIQRELEIIAGHSAEEHHQMPLFLPVDIDETFDHVRSWAREYTYELITGINARTRVIVSNAIEQYNATEGMTRAELEDMLMNTPGSPFGPSRAARIAVTETTRAYYEGGAEMAREAESLGIQIIHLWQTNRDDRVCDICGPLHMTARYGKPKGKYEYGWEIGPPAHVNCRCKVAYELVGADELES